MMFYFPRISRPPKLTLKTEVGEFRFYILNVLISSESNASSVVVGCISLAFPFPIELIKSSSSPNATFDPFDLTTDHGPKTYFN